MTAAGPADPLAVLLFLEERARAARTPEELYFSIANETWQLLPFRQGYVLGLDALGRPSLAAASGLAVLPEDSPLTVWLRQLARHLWPGIGQELRLLSAADCPAELADGWAEWLAPQLAVCPLRGPDGRLRAAALYALEAPLTDLQRQLLGRLGATYGYSLWALERQRVPQLERARAWLREKRWRRWAAAALVVLALFPVRLTALAPAEVIALDARVVAAPLDGVIKAFAVQPNEMVRKDQILFSFDDTTLRNRREIAAKALAVARADALVTSQKAFDSVQSKAELTVLAARVQERETEMAYLEELLARTEVRAEGDGIAIYGDPNDWIGKPVVTGERVMLLAKPKPLGILVWLPVADAINLGEGARIRMFLQVAPLSPLTARLTQTSYQAMLSADGIASYRVRGTVEGSPAAARIGLKGTAKIYGDWVPLIYYLLRRPLGAAREWLGL